MKKTMPLVEAFGYLRVSGRGQLDGDGFPRQKDAIQRYADAHGMTIVRWFQERAVCGATEWENRPAWSDMVQKLNGVRTVLVEKVERLARDLGVQEWILRDLKARGVVLVSATEENLDADPTRVLFRQMLGAIAQYDRAMTVLKLRAARRRIRAATGRCEGRKPYGELPGEGEVLARMTELRSQERTFDHIAALLNAEGVQTRIAGGHWYGSTVAKILRRAGKLRRRNGT
jgi:DNA invertase Pin-like site-specific DNA recombinase